MNGIDQLKSTSVAEFFAGIGLMREGLAREGWKVVFANDLSEDKREMYLAQSPESAGHFALGDVHALHERDVPTTTLATASFPCTDLSLAGMRNGLRGKGSSAYWGFVRLLREMDVRRPPLVLLENVAGLLTSHGGQDFRDVLRALNELGYAVDALVIDAERFVPQSRVRLFVIGAQGRPSGAASCRESQARPRALAEFILNHPDIAWSLRDVPLLPGRTLTLADVLEEIPEDSRLWWNRERTDYLLSQMNERHRAFTATRTGASAWTHGTVFRRVRQDRTMAELRVDGVAGCLRTPRGGSARQILLKMGYDRAQARLLTPRECARLMGAGDFRITTSATKALFGFGDAVCVPVVQWIARNYLEPLRQDMLAAVGRRRVRTG